MSKAKRTPAQWSIKPGVTKGAWIGHKNAPAALACGNTKEEAMANARLIAASPEMYEVIQEFCDRVERGEVRSKRTYSKFKELIKKIEQ